MYDRSTGNAALAEARAASSAIATARLQAASALAAVDDAIGGIGGSVSDGDKGDVVVAGGVWTIDPALISTYGRTLTACSTAALARGIIGLGSAALLASSAVLQSANNLADLGSAATARTNLGLGVFATATDAANLTGTIAAARMPALTGDVTSTAGSVALTIGANKVTRAMLAQTTGAAILGATAAGNVADLTAAQAKTFLAITEADVANLTADLAAKAPLASPQFTGVAFYQQPAPTAKTATGTLTIAELLTLIITSTSSTAVTLTLPTGTLTDAGILGGALAVNEAFEWYIINLGTSAGAVTLAAGTNHTIVGSPTVAISTSARFLTRKTAANTFVTYRIA